MPRTFRLVLEYDGADFAGWQVQPRGRPTVQGTLEAALARVALARVRVVGAGRTDAGVHAEAQLASVRLETRLAPEALHRALNAVLPADLAVRSLDVVPDDFHARRAATGKLYRYDLWNGPVRSPLRRRRALCLERPVDVAAMRRAAADLVGVHDFSSFQAAGSSVQSPVRELRRLEIEGDAGGAVRLLFEGSGFLRHMVRNLVGTLLEVGSGRRAPDGMPALLAARDRRRAGPTAPASALTLVHVDCETSGSPFRIGGECATLGAPEPREDRPMAARKKKTRAKKARGKALPKKSAARKGSAQKAAKKTATKRAQGGAARKKSAPAKGAKKKAGAKGAAKPGRSSSSGTAPSQSDSLRDIARSFAGRHLL